MNLVKDKSSALIQAVLAQPGQSPIQGRWKTLGRVMTVRVKLSFQTNPLHVLAGMNPAQKGMRFILGKLRPIGFFCWFFFSLWIIWPQYKSRWGGLASESSPEECFAEILTSFLLERMLVGQFSFRHKCVDLPKPILTSDAKPAGVWWQQQSILCFEITASFGIKEFC